MPKVVSTASELEKSWRNHKRACQGPLPSHRLLLYYAVEIGLKTLIAKNENLLNTDEVLGFVENHPLGQSSGSPSLGHRLDVLCECAKLDGAEKGPVPAATFTVRENVHGSHQMHEAWRYGALVEPSDYPNQMQAWLLHLIAVIKEKLSQ